MECLSVALVLAMNAFRGVAWGELALAMAFGRWPGKGPWIRGTGHFGLCPLALLHDIISLATASMKIIHKMIAACLQGDVNCELTFSRSVTKPGTPSHSHGTNIESAATAGRRHTNRRSA
jgi:hypothetical protein